MFLLILAGTVLCLVASFDLYVFWVPVLQAAEILQQNGSFSQG